MTKLRIAKEKEGLIIEEGGMIRRGDYGVYHVGRRSVEGELAFIDEDSFTITTTTKKTVQKPFWDGSEWNTRLEVETEKERVRIFPEDVHYYSGQCGYLGKDLADKL